MKPRDTLFKYRCYSNHPTIKALADTLFKRFLESRRNRIHEEKRRNKLKRNFRVALAAMYLGDADDAHGSFVRITLKNDHYYGKTRLSPIFQSELLQVLKWLIAEGYLEKVAEPVEHEGRWRPAGYRLGTRCIELAAADNTTASSIKASIFRRTDAPLVELRQGKKPIRLKAHPQKTFSLKLLEHYEQSLQQHRFTIGSVELPPFAFSLTRIYSNGSYLSGGRFYSLFQGRRSQTRLHLRIDGEPTCEVDYVSLHPALLYLKENLESLSIF